MTNLNKGIIIVLMLTVGIFLTACSGGTGTVTAGKSFIGGTKALDVSLLGGNPPEIVTDGGTQGFSIVLKAENQGETDIAANDGYVQIEGMDPNLYNSQVPNFKKYFNEPIRGAVKNFDGTVVNGGISTIEYPELKYQSTIQGDMIQSYQADICYKYTTKMSSQLCVKNDAEKALSSKEICIVEEEKNPQNSGGPIQVTSLKESYAGNGKIGVSVTLQHTGTGDAFFKDNKLDCNNVESNNDKGKVKLTFTNVQIAGRSVPVVCSGVTDGYVKLYKDGSGKETTSVYCTVDVSGSSNIVQVPIEAELGYVYLQHVAGEFTIRHVTK